MRQQQLSVGFTEICTVIAFKKVEGIMGMSNKEIAWRFVLMVSGLGLACASSTEWVRLLGWISATGASWYFINGFLDVLRPAAPSTTAQPPIEPSS